MRELNAGVAISDPPCRSACGLPIVFYSGNSAPCFTRLRHSTLTALGVVSFDAATLLQQRECCSRYRVPRGALGRHGGSVCCTTLNDKEIGTRGRDVRRSPTFQSVRSVALHPAQRHLNRRHLLPFVSGFGVADFSDHAFSVFLLGHCLAPVGLALQAIPEGEPWTHLALIARGDCLRRGAMHYWQ